MISFTTPVDRQRANDCRPRNARKSGYAFLKIPGITYLKVFPLCNALIITKKKSFGLFFHRFQIFPIYSADNSNLHMGMEQWLNYTDRGKQRYLLTYSMEQSPS